MPQSRLQLRIRFRLWKPEGWTHMATRPPCLYCRILDNLPIGMVRMREDQGELVKTYERGFPVGFQDVSSRLLPHQAHGHFQQRCALFIAESVPATGCLLGYHGCLWLLLPAGLNLLTCCEQTTQGRFSPERHFRS
jgi:hypothetical protein